jgi:hypothetical protein
MLKWDHIGLCVVLVLKRRSLVRAFKSKTSLPGCFRWTQGMLGDKSTIAICAKRCGWRSRFKPRLESLHHRQGVKETLLNIRKFAMPSGAGSTEPTLTPEELLLLLKSSDAWLQCGEIPSETASLGGSFAWRFG